MEKQEIPDNGGLMRTLIHLSDLHFGKVDYAITKPLIETIKQLEPDVIAVSGDLTQRARSRQFKEARAFLDTLPSPQIVVPGNHDIPAHNLFTRFLQPLDKYKRYITNDLQPFYADQEIAVFGVNTARSLTVKDGRINDEQIAQIHERFRQLDETITKLIVSHHPFDLPAGHDEDDLVDRAAVAMKVLAEIGVDVFISGHLHIAHTGQTAKRSKISGHSALVVQAGTATSTRKRGEANSFNVIRINHPHITIERLIWQPARARFELSSTEHFRHTEAGWLPE
jgi:3',5'-cyclic AMP phosphodiesterase CpdA